jgi:hypothetical protein
MAATRYGLAAALVTILALPGRCAPPKVRKTAGLGAMRDKDEE